MDFEEAHFRHHSQELMIVNRDVLWYGGKGALQWHTPDFYYRHQDDKHYVTKCGLPFVYGLPPRPGAEKYSDCVECHETGNRNLYRTK